MPLSGAPSGGMFHQQDQALSSHLLSVREAKPELYGLLTLCGCSHLVALKCQHTLVIPFPLLLKTGAIFSLPQGSIRIRGSRQRLDGRCPTLASCNDRVPVTAPHTPALELQCPSSSSEALPSWPVAISRSPSRRLIRSVSWERSATRRRICP